MGIADLQAFPGAGAQHPLAQDDRDLATLSASANIQQRYLCELRVWNYRRVNLTS